MIGLNFSGASGQYTNFIFTAHLKHTSEEKLGNLEILQILPFFLANLPQIGAFTPAHNAPLVVKLPCFSMALYPVSQVC
jgi:hypothetical protein